MSLRGQDNEETSFFCLAPISMTIESKDFFRNATPRVPFSSLITILWRGGIGLSLRFLTYFVMRTYHVISFSGVRGGVEWMRGTVYNGGEIQGGFADEI